MAKKKSNTTDVTEIPVSGATDTTADAPVEVNRVRMRFRPVAAAEAFAKVCNAEGFKAVVEVGKDRLGLPDPVVVVDDMPRKAYLRLHAAATALVDGKSGPEAA